MYKPNCLVVYKNKPALLKETGEKYIICTAGGETVRVREKDIEFLHPGPLANLRELEHGFSADFAREAWELYSGEAASFSLRDLAELNGSWSPQNAWNAYLLLHEGLYFQGTVAEIRPKPADAVTAAAKKRALKEEEDAQRDAFLDRLRTKKLNLPDDRRFLQDIEALALGKSDKSRTMRDARWDETPEAAHALLLETGIWTPLINPYPSRFGIALSVPKHAAGPPPSTESRTDLTALAAFAIDDESSNDPDDAISLEQTAEGLFLYVHVADPSSVIAPDSAADREARERGATFYGPEITVRMLRDDVLAQFALGLERQSPALTFKLMLNDAGNIERTEILRSLVRVTRLSYRAACDESALAPLFELSNRNLRRRLAAGAVTIEFPEVAITIHDERINIAPLENYPSRLLVKECMLLAGEAAAQWALEQRLPFPFISQEVDSVPGDLLPGFAGSYQMRRCMRSRVLSSKPGLHQGLGLDIYTQVTSPLRRYTDLLAHQQISAVLRGEKPLDEDMLLARLAAAERAAFAVSRAERASRAHWTAACLAARSGDVWDGIVLDVRGPHAVVLIPALGIETQTALKRGSTLMPNDHCTLKLSSVKISAAETRWVMVDENSS
ncbi:MAG: RNB domain-containing ribonuclease [Spirochaetaceae bacterium]|nr:RNB domain-containing ribonuclease [Spirochaetaceae bacterium]